MTTMSKQDSTHVEEAVGDDKLQVNRSRVGVSGTVQLTAGKTVYIPTPTADPRGMHSGLRLEWHCADKVPRQTL